jgi:hypothetical protein
LQKPFRRCRFLNMGSTTTLSHSIICICIMCIYIHICIWYVLIHLLYVYVCYLIIYIYTIMIYIYIYMYTHIIGMYVIYIYTYMIWGQLFPRKWRICGFCREWFPSMEIAGLICQDVAQTCGPEVFCILTHKPHTFKIPLGRNFKERCMDFRMWFFSIPPAVLSTTLN